jgi:hypothetical protein
MEKVLEIKWPWEMTWQEHVDVITEQIRNALPPDHELQTYDLFPDLKWDGRPIFIVADDTTGQRILMDFEKTKRWKKTRFKVPTMKVFKDTAELAEQIEADHLAERAKYIEDDAPE